MKSVLRLKITIMLIITTIFSSSDAMKSLVVPTTKAEQKSVELVKLDLPQRGGIQSLCVATKGDSELCIIGHARSEEFEYGKLSWADAQAKQLILSQLGRWENGTTPIALHIFDSAEDCKAYSTVEKEGNNSKTFIIPAHASVGLLAHDNNYRIGNLEIIPSTFCIPYEERSWDPTCYFKEDNFSAIAKLVGLESSVRAVDFYIQCKERAEKQRFYANGNKFTTLITAIKKSARTAGVTSKTLAEHQQLLSDMAAQAHRLSAESIDDFQKALFEQLERVVTIALQDQESFLSTYGITDLSTTLLDVLATIIRAKGSMDAGCIEFRAEFIYPLFTFINITNHLAVVDVAAKKNKLVILHPSERVDHLLTILTLAGYCVHNAGKIARNRYALSAEPLAHVFSQGQIALFLSTRFGNKDVDPSLIPLLENGSLPVRQTAGLVVENGVSAATKSDSSLTITLMESEKNEEDGDMSCLTCEKKVKRSNSRIVLNDRNTCSMGCTLVLMVKKTAPDLCKLLNKTQLARKDRPVLLKIAALSYLMFLLLNPLSGSQSSIFHELPHTGIAHSLNTLSKDPQWAKMRTTTAGFKLDCTRMRIYMEAYARLKTAHRDAKLVQAKDRSLKKSQKNEILFDQDGSWQQLLTNENAALSKAFSMQGTNSFFARIYYLLMRRISQQVSFTPADFQKILANN